MLIYTFIKITIYEYIGLYRKNQPGRLQVGFLYILGIHIKKSKAEIINNRFKL